MSSVKFRDSDGNVYYLNMADGDGTESSPFVGPGDATAVNLPVYVTQSGDGTAQEVYVTGCLMVKDCTGVGGVVEGLLVTGEASKPLYIHDGGASLTVDNTSGSPLYIHDAGASLTVDNTSGSPLYVSQVYVPATYESRCKKTTFVTGSATSISTDGTPNDRYIVKAPETNNATIWISWSATEALVSGNFAFPMYPGVSFDINATPLNTWYGVCESVGIRNGVPHVNNCLYILSD
jgi:hypothetical protein